MPVWNREVQHVQSSVFLIELLCKLFSHKYMVHCAKPCFVLLASDSYTFFILYFNTFVYTLPGIIKRLIRQQLLHSNLLRFYTAEQWLLYPNQPNSFLLIYLWNKEWSTSNEPVFIAYIISAVMLSTPGDNYAMLYIIRYIERTL